ncbi:hypothetical protein [Caballeronia sp. AZ10_KS36]|nr:hypothetical protein [Caballeronia sp. AZ10_KS36]
MVRAIMPAALPVYLRPQWTAGTASAGKARPREILVTAMVIANAKMIRGT